jgi:hypothetical protein
MKFKLQIIGGPDLPWLEGHAGHCELKDILMNSPEIESFRARVLSRILIKVQGNLTPAQLVNMAMTLSKASDHVTYICGNPFGFFRDTHGKWKSHSKNFAVIKDDLAGSQVEVVRGDVGSVLDDSPRASEMHVSLLVAHRKVETVCAVTRRVVNLLEWGAKMQKKLTSMQKFKWATFDSISSKRTL